MPASVAVSRNDEGKPNELAWLPVNDSEYLDRRELRLSDPVILSPQYSYRLNRASAASRISFGSLIRPSPLARQLSQPEEGPTK